jgi:hypothetical protein
MIVAMIAIAKPIATAIHLPRWVLPRLSATENRRKQTTIDLIHSSPHLLRDIGVGDGQISPRDR